MIHYTETKTYRNTSHTGSDKYSVVQTGAIVEMIKANSNLDVWHYQEAGVRNQARIGLQNHLIRMRDTSLPSAKDDIIPELVLLNSYDKTKAFKIYLGFFRVVCENGLVMGDEIAGFSMRHINFDYDALMSFVANFPRLAIAGREQVEIMKTTQLSDAQYLQLAKEVFYLKMGVNNEENVSDNDKVIFEREAGRLLNTRRLEDKSRDAFTQMNVIQENILRGRKGGYGKLRPIKQIAKQVQINRYLWDRTLELVAAELVAA